MTNTIDYALTCLASQQDDYHKYRRYYEGDQDLSFASDAFRSSFGRLFHAFAYNRCAPVVDSLADRLIVAGWEADSNDKVEQHATDIWERNRANLVAGTVHVEALREGDSYAIVWPDENGLAKINAQRADLCRVITDPETGLAEVGVKVWRIEYGEYAGQWRLTVYGPDQITRWISEKSDTRPKTMSKFYPFEDEHGAAAVPNPYAVVPLIHFPNNALFDGDLGRSELCDVIPLQDGLNKSIADQMVAGEFVAFPQRWAVGVEPVIDPVTGKESESFRPGVDRIFEISNENARFGEFMSMDMRQFVDIQDAWDAKISRVSRVPVHWLGQSGDFPSGEALKTAESPFTSKVRDRQTAFGEQWSKLMQLALQIEGVKSPVRPMWQPAEPRSDREFWELAMMKRTVGIPDKQTWIEAGYTPEQVTEFELAAQAKTEQASTNFGLAFNRGNV